MPLGGVGVVSRTRGATVNASLHAYHVCSGFPKSKLLLSLQVSPLLLFSAANGKFFRFYVIENNNRVLQFNPTAPIPNSTCF